jgi:type IV pilus assembly protein PilO
VNNLLMKLDKLGYDKILLIGLALMGFYYFTAFDGGGNIEAQLSSVNAQIQGEQTKKAETDRLLAEETQMRQEVGQLADKFKEVSLKLPAELNSIALISSIQKMAKAAGASIKNIRPESPKRQDILEELPITVTIEGKYSDLALFVYYISSMERIAKVSDFTIVRVGDNNNKLQLNGHVMSFRYNPATVQGTQAPGTAAPPNAGGVE